MYSPTQSTGYQPSEPNGGVGSVLRAVIPIALAAYGWACFGCSTPTNSKSELRSEVGIEQFVNQLPRNSRVLLGYDRWDYTPGPGKFPQAPSTEVLEKELIESRNQNNPKRTRSIEDTLAINSLLQKRGINTYLTGLQVLDPSSAIYSRDFSANYIISGLPLEREQVKSLSEWHRKIGEHVPASPTQISNTRIRFYLLNEGKLEEITEELK